MLVQVMGQPEFVVHKAKMQSRKLVDYLFISKGTGICYTGYRLSHLVWVLQGGGGMSGRGNG